MSGLFGAPRIQQPAPPPPPTRGRADVLAAAGAERLRRTRQQGRASTILTGGQGIVNGTQAPVKTLLGA